MKYPQSRLKLAVQTAEAVRLIIDVLADQAELAESLVNLCVQDAYDQMEASGLAETGVPAMKSPAQSDPQFGFNNREVRDLDDGEDEDYCEDDEECSKINKISPPKEGSSWGF